MIGIGVTSINEERYKTFLEHLDANTSNYKFASAINVKGVRKAKNQLLYELKDCDHIYLFDDDCYPIKNGWTDFMGSALEDQNHYQYNTEAIHGKMTTVKIGNTDVLVTYNSGGVFMAFTRKVIEVAGFMSPQYDGYGWEHLGYSQRIYHHGLTLNPYVCPVGLDKFLHAEDYVRPTNKTMTKEEEEQKDKNYKVFRKEAFDIEPKRIIYGMTKQ